VPIVRLFVLGDETNVLFNCMCSPISSGKPGRNVASELHAAKGSTNVEN
jgi:hypothetical protein